MKLSNLILLSIVTIAFFYIYLWDNNTVAPLYLIFLLVCYIYNTYTKDVNSSHITLFILLMTLAEYIVFISGLLSLEVTDENRKYQGALIFGTQVLFSIMTFFILIFRVQISRMISNSKKIKLTNFDGLFHWLFLYSGVIAFLALIEHLARHLLGLKSITIIYDSYEALVYIAWALNSGLLLSMMIISTKNAQEPHLSN